MWPFTFFIKGSEILYKTYKESWRYLGSIGRYVVDFFVILSLIAAAINYEEGKSVSLGSIWGTLSGYVVFQGTVTGL